MAVLEGAMLGGTFLPEKEFKDIIKEYFDNTDNVKKIRIKLSKILSDTDNIKTLYDKVEEIETELFKNPTVSLLLITNLKSTEGEYEQYQKSQEGKVVKEGGGLSYLEATKKSLIQQKYSQYLSEHLIELINYVELTELSNEEIKKYFHDNKFSSVKTKGEMGTRARENRSLMYIIYGNKTLDKRRGQIADAFLNHLGNLHKNLFGNGIKNLEMNLSPFSQSVVQEEGDNLIQILIDSTNSAGQQTGGDLILLDNNKVIANIQLKTIQKEKQTDVGSISNDKILEKLQKLREFIDKDIVYNRDRFADICYDTFKTSAITDDISKVTIKEATNIARKALDLTK